MNQMFENFRGWGDLPFGGAGWPFGEHTPRSNVVETDVLILGNSQSPSGADFPHCRVPEYGRLFS